MKTRFIFNPCSGRNVKRPWLARHIRDFIAAHRLPASLVTTAAPGHATQLAREALADGCERVVAVGGDGTMNEIAQALLHSPASLGLVPCGSGNGLALHLRLPTALDAALDLAASPSAVTLAIDTGTANGRPFFNAMGAGFDADISHRFNRLSRRGLWAYARTGFQAFLQRRTQHVVIHAGGQRYPLDTLLVAIANSDQYGNNARIAPGARVDDGRLDLVAVRPVGFATALPLVTRLFLGQLHRSPRVLHLRSSRFVIARGGPGLIHTDGETHETGAEIEVVVHPRSLRLLVPPGTATAWVDRRKAPHRASPAPAPLGFASAFS
ncbi:MAG TPA: diacylglycerol kinase family protein [Opitutus sp.]|nr:diacylglycerol kinase family protein [Opitutus sp.]